MSRIVGQAINETAEIVKMLAEVKVGETITYSSISEAIGVDLVKRRHLLESARRIVMRENEAVFSAEINVGLRRLSDVEIVTLQPELRRKKIRTQAKAAIREVTTVDYGKLPDDKKAQHTVGLSLFGSVYQATERSSIKRLTKQVENGKMPDTDGTLRLIGWIIE